MIKILHQLHKKYRDASRMMRKHSTIRILNNNFPVGSDFSMIQVGANDGISFDFLYDFVKQRNTSGIVIEPVPGYYQELVENYKNLPKILPVNMAVHPEEKSLEMYRLNPDAAYKYPEWAKGIASLDFMHHKKTKISDDDIITENVRADHLSNIIKQYFQGDISKLDYFQSDTEGFDSEIISMIDFDFMQPKILKYESLNMTKAENQKIKHKLQKLGYYVFDEDEDTVAIDLKRIQI